MSTSSQHVDESEVIVIDLTHTANTTSELGTRLVSTHKALAKLLSPFWEKYKQCTDIKVQFSKDGTTFSTLVRRLVPGEHPESTAVHKRSWESFLATRLYAAGEDTNNTTTGKTLATCLGITATGQQLRRGYTGYRQDEQLAAAIKARVALQQLEARHPTRDTTQESRAKESLVLATSIEDHVAQCAAYARAEVEEVR